MQTITTIGLDIAKSVFHFTELMPLVRGVVHRSHFAWRQTGSPPDTATDQIRTGDQPQDRQGARPRRASLFAAARRRGDRIVTLIAAVHESVVGTKRTCRNGRLMSALGGEADVRQPGRDVRV